MEKDSGTNFVANIFMILLVLALITAFFGGFNESNNTAEQQYYEDQSDACSDPLYPC